MAEAVANAPDDGTFLHWLGLAELRRGRAAEAIARFEGSLKARRPPAAGRARVKEDLRLARAALAGGTGAAVEVTAPDYRPEVLRFEEVPRWEGSIGVASGWDSNPELVTEDRPFTLPGETAPGGVPSDAMVSLDAEARFQPVVSLHGWSLGLDLSGHQSKYQQEDAVDLTMAGGTASLSWGGPLLADQRVPRGEGRLAFLLQAGGSRAWLSGDSYRDTTDLAAALFVRETPSATTRLGVSWSDRDFAGGLPLLRPSGRELSGSVDQWVFFGRPDGSLRLGAAAGRYDAERSFERTFWEVSAGAEVPLAPRWALDLTGGFRDDDYANQESSLLGDPLAPPRHDTTWRASATTTWRAAGHLSWTLRVSHIQRNSNVETPFPAVPLLDYERTVVSLGATCLF
ncbi:MAG TPA: hypothetical protein VEW48_15165 [Thermoanaerobaculia bacterium]|nr:hypothetical protein [Thermoanaerobaculia bacterium]